MEPGEGLARRARELRQRFPDMRRRIAAIAEGAALRAVERAAELTPPNTFGNGELRGVNMITGELAQHWATDSVTTPVSAGDSLITALANDKEYASYVNDGHRLDRHFVPGLYIDEDGLLSMDLSKPPGVGLMVGTKTTYVEGLHMVDASAEVYHEVVETESERLVREVERL